MVENILTLTDACMDNKDIGKLSFVNFRLFYSGYNFCEKMKMMPNFH